jgi:flagellar motor switch protein FliG
MAETGLAPRTGRPASRPVGVEKAAILLLTLGPEAATAVLRHLSESEVRQVSAALARLRSIPREHAAVVSEEAWRRLSGHEGMLVDGEQFARQVLNGARAGERDAEAARELDRVTRAGGEFLAASLEPVGAGALAELLATEHPQAIALVLANLSARKAADVLGALPEALRPDVVQRIARLQSVPDELLVDVGDVLHGLVQGMGGARQETGTTGARLAAEILNVAGAAIGDPIFAHLDEHAPEVGETIRQLMLTFEDLIRLDNRGMQMVLKEVQREDLMRALKTASPGMRDKIFANLSQRAADILKDDMSTMGPVRLKEVEKAQAAIVATVRRLESEQRITLGGGGDDVIA